MYLDVIAEADLSRTLLLSGQQLKGHVKFTTYHKRSYPSKISVVNNNSNGQREKCQGKAVIRYDCPLIYT